MYGDDGAAKSKRGWDMISRFEAAEYEIIPTETFKIMRNCSGCGSKAVYFNTNKIRVNANGKQVDVWLIYQCTKCKHTYNLPIYSRINKTRLNKAEYEALLQNDQDIVFQYGLDRVIFQKNNAVILEEPAYVLKDTGKDAQGDVIRFRNPYRLRIRYDRLIADCLKISRSEAKRFLENGVLVVDQTSENEVIFQYTPIRS